MDRGATEMNVTINGKEYELVQVFSLRKSHEENTELLKQAQTLSLDNTRPLLGLSPAQGLYGTEEWWENIANGKINTFWRHGIIMRRFCAGMESGKQNSFDYSNDSDNLTYSESFRANKTVPQGKGLYQVGHYVSIRYVEEVLKDSEAPSLHAPLEVYVSRKKVS